MKKLTAVLLVLTMIISMLGIASFAAESSEEPAADDTTFRALPYDENGIEPSVWLNVFDDEGAAIGSDYVIFNSAAPIKAVGLPVVYSGTSENTRDSEAKFELFKWDTDIEKTLSSTPVLNETVYFDGDHRDLSHFVLSEVQPAGQYLFRVSQVSGREEGEDGPYIVLAISAMRYGDNRLEFGAKGPFAFYFDCEKTEGVNDYFKLLEGKENEIDIQPEKTVIAREGGAHEIFEYGIVTPVVPDGQVLYTLTLTAAPTWTNTNGDSDVTYEVYKWTGDYDESIEGRLIDSGEILDHADNSNLTLKFGTNLRYGYSYLVLILRSNDGKIGYWEGSPEWPEGWMFFEGGSELDISPALRVSYAISGDLGPEPTDPPTKEPTEVPVTNPPTEAPATKEPTDAPAATEVPATDAPVATDAPEITEKSSSTESKKSPVLPIILGICGAIVVASVIVIIVVSKSKKK